MKLKYTAPHTHHSLTIMNFILSAYRPSLPSNILELGHPDLIPKLMPILPEEEDNNGAADLLPTLSDETLAEIWKKYVNNARRIL